MDYSEIILLVIMLIFIAFIISAQQQESFETNNTKQVILFYAPWCSYSQNFLTLWKQIIKKKEFRHIDFIKVNIDENTTKANLFKIKYVPMVFIQKGETIIKCPKPAMTSLSQFNNFIIKSF